MTCVVAFVASLLLAGPGVAQASQGQNERPVVMELFSSQNCGNCPAANQNLIVLSRRPDILALTYPVGYWDYLGANDAFARPEFGKRQVRYNRQLSHRGPYTPQIIYSGLMHGSGVNLVRIEAKLATRDRSPFPLQVAFEDDGVLVSGEAEGSASVVLVRFKPGVTRSIPEGGTNRGKQMAYINLVTAFEPLGTWEGGAQRFPVRCNTGCAVLAHKGGLEGPVIGAGRR